MELTKEERLNKLLKILSEHQKISTKELQAIMQVSISTLRRDLLDLEMTNSIRRTHGYVSLLEYSNVEMAYATRRGKNENIKNRLCKKAAPLITNDQAIFLDGSSTLEFFPKYFANKSNLHVITNNINLAAEVNQLKNVELSVLGGNLLYRSKSILGPRAIADLQQNFRPNIAFISCSSLDAEGIYMANEEQKFLKKTVMQCSEQTVLLVDHTKFNQKDYILLSDYDSVSIKTIITDQLPPQEILETIQANDIQLLLAE
ncbi:DeoR family transcriptional regulator [Ligilactobacillus salitolerans]|uniref:Lactose phosphotransferase system repressor n=1 Tax=Ligilactobacillus salitolerans TaxID=1808352 RepID=A0A401IVV8_9LACO|nr:DeoR/GlpR family DNA-binding transcription regulator [Ligilactobacillus salitolerans]GBG95691.1 DeoR family transcriptional regulator [Ligilactobacillus salitolerans]